MGYEKKTDKSHNGTGCETREYCENDRIGTERIKGDYRTDEDRENSDNQTDDKHKILGLAPHSLMKKKTHFFGC